MSTTLELKIRIRELEARVKALEAKLCDLDGVERYCGCTLDKDGSQVDVCAFHLRQTLSRAEKLAEKAEVSFGVDFGVTPAISSVQDSHPITGTSTISSLVDPDPKKAYKLCPKCGVKPAYFFHVRSCKG
jgi:hypothetical protein